MIKRDLFLRSLNGGAGVCSYSNGNDLEGRGELDEAGRTSDVGIGWIPPKSQSEREDGIPK